MFLCGFRSRALNPTNWLVEDPVEKMQNYKQSFKAVICKLSLTNLELNKVPFFSFEVKSYSKLFNKAEVSNFRRSMTNTVFRLLFWLCKLSGDSKSPFVSRTKKQWRDSYLGEQIQQRIHCFPNCRRYCFSVLFLSKIRSCVQNPSKWLVENPVEKVLNN